MPLLKKKILISFLIALFVLIFSFIKTTDIFAVTESDCLNKSPSQLSANEMDECINTILPRIAAAYAPAQEKNKANLANLKSQINSLNQRITSISNQLKVTEIEMKEREKDLAYTKVLFDQKARDQYTFLRLYDPITPFLFSDNASQAFQEISLRQRAADSDRKTLEEYAADLLSLKTDKENFEKNKVSLASLQKKVNEDANFLAKEVSKVESFLATVSTKQQELLAQKLGSLGLPLTLGAGALSCTDDRKLDPGFSPAFAFYTFGIPHYVGMNQYGAYGRATFDGQNYKTILQAYYANSTIECRDVPATINVQDYGTLSFEDYIKGVVNKEMGADIPEALKAQAVAARSYALNQSQPICKTQYCQVYSSNRRSAADSAVDATGVNACGAGKAEVLVSNGKIITAWYASTFGGYAHKSSIQLPNAGNTSYTKEFADTQGSINSFSDLFQKAYDRESKCFYSAQGWRKEYGNSAWLKQEEVADIANVILLARKDSSVKQHLCQTDKPPNPQYGCSDTWSADRVKEELSSRGGTPISGSISVSISGVDWNSGKTTQININGQSFSGDEFKSWFNLRAPANIQIVGPLFNVETR